MTRIPSHRHLWSYIVALLIGLGILFRVANLAQPVYWVDEVATSMRVSGYTQAEVVAQVATGEPLTVTDLQKFQTIRPDRPASDLLRVLSQSPEHAPLYFILARVWAEIFGNSIAAMRSLSVVFSVLALPAIYGLAYSLFHCGVQTKKQRIETLTNRRGWSFFASDLIGRNAIALLAISPFFIAYAQEARPYSLWVLLLLLMNMFLWRSLQLNRWQDWLAYTISLTLCLYTSLLTVLIVFGQSLAIIGLQSRVYKKRKKPYLATTITALLALSPWIWIVVTRWQTLQDNTIWMQVPSSIWAILGTWFYSLAVLFFDVPVASESPPLFVLQVIAATATLSFMAYAAYLFIRRASRSVVIFVLSTSLAVPLLLLLLDLLRDGQASATPRYLMPTHLGALIALAFFLGHCLTRASRRWNSIISMFLCVGLLSCVIGITQDSPYQKSRNLSNASITAILNAAQNPQLITTTYYTQDTISLSYQLDPDICLYILPNESKPKEWLPDILSNDRPTFFFSPTEEMKVGIKANQLGHLKSVFQPAPLISGGYGLTLWQIEVR